MERVEEPPSLSVDADMRRTQWHHIRHPLMTANKNKRKQEQVNSRVLEACFGTIPSTGLLRRAPWDDVYWMDHLESIVLIEDWCLLFAIRASDDV
jgi:hypothetical protein